MSSLMTLNRDDTNPAANTRKKTSMCESVT